MMNDSIESILLEMLEVIKTTSEQVDQLINYNKEKSDDLLERNYLLEDKFNNLELTCFRIKEMLENGVDKTIDEVKKDFGL